MVGGVLEGGVLGVVGVLWRVSREGEGEGAWKEEWILKEKVLEEYFVGLMRRWLL